MNKTTMIASSTVLAIGIALSGLFVSAAIIKAKQSDQYVTVKGLAEKVVKSNQATWVIHFNAANDNLNQLYQSVASAQSTVEKFLVQQGFQKNNITLKPIAVTDNLSNSYGNNSHAKRYTASTSVTLVTSRVDQTAIAVQKTGELVKQGVVVSQSNVQYSFTQLNKVKPLMLVAATEHAKKAAFSFADHSKSVLGKIRDASQGLFTISNMSSDYSAGSSVMKKVRVVTTVEYFLK